MLVEMNWMPRGYRMDDELVQFGRLHFCENHHHPVDGK